MIHRIFSAISVGFGDIECDHELLSWPSAYA